MENNEEFNSSSQDVETNTEEPSTEVSGADEVTLETEPKAEKKHFTFYKKYWGGAALVVLIIVVGIFLFNNQDRHVAVKQFTNVYSFVPEKISKSAPIQINVPEGVDEDTARNSISLMDYLLRLSHILLLHDHFDMNMSLTNKSGTVHLLSFSSISRLILIKPKN
jgi:hypothetical protein